MSHRRWCDATARLEKPGETFTSFGTVIERHYCDKAAAEVQKFYDAIDELHTRLADEFHAERIRLRQLLITRWPQIYLPDETDEATEKRIAEWEAVSEPKKGKKK